MRNDRIRWRASKHKHIGKSGKMMIGETDTPDELGRACRKILLSAYLNAGHDRFVLRNGLRNRRSGIGGKRDHPTLGEMTLVGSED